MSQPELLKRVIRVLNDLNIAYMATGSVASSLQGEPRATHDIDLVVSLERMTAPKLSRAFPPPAFYLEEQSILDAVRKRGMFNLIDMDTGDKVDFWILTDDPFDRSRFGRRYVERVMETDVVVSTPEDTILQKLKWAKLSGGSEKHVTDALRVYEVQYAKLDLTYLKKWAEKIDVSVMLEKLEEKAEPSL
jgi:hypothetical protein